MNEEAYNQAVDRARALILTMTARYLLNVHAKEEEYSDRYIEMMTRLAWLHNRFAVKSHRPILTSYAAELALKKYGQW